MPLYIQQNIEHNLMLAVWHITESKDELKNLIGDDFFEHNMHEKMEKNSARHYLASRALLAQQFYPNKCHLHKNEFNKPLLEINGAPHYVSITHSHDYAAIIFSKTMEVGIDLELVDRRINRVAHKFMNEIETSYAGDENQITEKTIIWSAKETLYKIYGEKAVDFKMNLFIDFFELKEKGSMQTRIKKDHYENRIQLNYACFDKYVLTYGTLRQAQGKLEMGNER